VHNIGGRRRGEKLVVPIFLVLLGVLRRGRGRFVKGQWRHSVDQQFEVDEHLFYAFHVLTQKLEILCETFEFEIAAFVQCRFRASMRFSK
jgi:hypothetical protein